MYMANAPTSESEHSIPALLLPWICHPPSMGTRKPGWPEAVATTVALT